MSNLSASKGFKVTIGGVSALIGIIVGLQPYLSLKTIAENHASEIKQLKVKADVDHDLIIKMSTDIQYIKESMQEFRRQK